MLFQKCLHLTATANEMCQQHNLNTIHKYWCTNDIVLCSHIVPHTRMYCECVLFSLASSQCETYDKGHVQWKQMNNSIGAIEFGGHFCVANVVKFCFSPSKMWRGRKKPNIFLTRVICAFCITNTRFCWAVIRWCVELSFFCSSYTHSFS